VSPRSPQHLALGDAIRARRSELGLSQEQLAHAADVDRTYVGGIERGERNPALQNLLRIAAALEIELSELLASASL
jgi:transcriptional regulator with XRE-family HTH domain